MFACHFSHSQLGMSFFSSGVVSVSFEEDEDGNLCLIAYPLNGDHDNLESLDNSDCETKNKLLRWTNKKTVLLENEKVSKEWVRQHRKEEKMKRWVTNKSIEIIFMGSRFALVLEALAWFIEFLALVL